MVKRFFYLVLLVGAVIPHCWAPIEQAPPTNRAMLHEATAPELQHNQQFQRTQGEVGYVPQRASENGDVMSEVSDRAAGSNLVAAQNQSEQSESERAKKVLQDAEQGLQKESNKASGWLWTFVFGAFGFATIVGFRTWAAKNIPTGPPGFKPEPEKPVSSKQVW